MKNFLIAIVGLTLASDHNVLPQAQPEAAKRRSPAEYCSLGAIDDIPAVALKSGEIDFEAKELHLNVERLADIGGDLLVRVESFGQEMDKRREIPLQSMGDFESASIGDMLPVRKPAQLRATVFVRRGNETSDALDTFERVVVPKDGGYLALRPSEFQPASSDVEDSVTIRVRTGWPDLSDEIERNGEKR